jgi:hypothetical protein
MVLILGRFRAERKAVLDALREELRKHDTWHCSLIAGGCASLSGVAN